MLEQQRQRLIIDLLEEKQFVRLQELVDTLNASPATVRRDINKLAAEGRLSKIHGGAQLSTSGPAPRVPRKQLQGAAFLANLERQVAEKRAIAERAVALCQDGETILINGGSSTFMMAEFLCARDINVLTNSFALAGVLLESGRCRVTLPGGELAQPGQRMALAFDIQDGENYALAAWNGENSAWSLGRMVNDQWKPEQEVGGTLEPGQVSILRLQRLAKGGVTFFVNGEPLLTSSTLELQGAYGVAAGTAPITAENIGAWTTAP